MNNNKIFQFKLVLLGESAVGKSSLVLRFVKGQFLEFQESTIGGMYLYQLLKETQKFCQRTVVSVIVLSVHSVVAHYEHH